MTVVALPRPASGTGRAPARPVLAMARFEARRMLRHPVFLLATGITLMALFGSDTVNRPNDAYLGMTSYGLVSIGIGAFVAAHRATDRGRRDGVAELSETAPMPRRRQTAAHLLSVVAPVAAAVAIVGLAAAFISANDGPTVATTEGLVRRTPSFVEVLQGPAFVAFCGVLGVALARWARSAAVLMMSAFVLYITAVNNLFWDNFPSAKWFMPVASHEVEVGSVGGPNGYSILSGFEVAALGWHVAYLAGVIGVLACVALAREGRRARLAPALVASVALASVAGVLQVG